MIKLLMNCARGEAESTNELYKRGIPRPSFILGMKFKGSNELKKDRNYSPINDIRK
jgi:hypothetical protein